MTTLKMTEYTMPAADLGSENLMPDIKNVEYIHAGYTCTDRVSAEEKAHIGEGMISTVLPYTILDNYNRQRKMKDFPAAVLENDYLKATFLPTLGGRLWSLYDKRLNRELLYVNSVFQPANLAIRNAWFSGGVEFNVGIKGHNPLTCDPLFTEVGTSPSGEPVLRMYEYERIRGVVYSIEAYMPGNDGVLYLRNTVENTEKKDKYTYWWSNIAVPETKDTRVIVPADDSFICYYNEGSYLLDKTPVPVHCGTDYSYPLNSSRSQDFFYKIPKDRPKWIAAVEADGKGLIHFSGSRLIGRKVFIWGQGAGGRHWAEFLSNPGESYIEIQAGLAHTQLEHIPLGGGEKISWIEGYFAADCKPSDIHGDWAFAQNVIESEINKHVNLQNADSELLKIFPDKINNRKIVMQGSGWGYIENLMRKRLKKPLISAEFNFPESSVTHKEQPWLSLLTEGSFGEHGAENPPESYMASPDFIPLAENAADNWYGALQLGILYYANGEVKKAKSAMEQSAALKPNAWAYRNLAMLAKNEEKDIAAAVSYINKAIALNKSYRGLIVNCAQIYTAAEEYNSYIDLYNTLDEKLKSDGRILFYLALSHLKTGNAKAAAEIITPDFVMCDIKEGEVSISHLWYEIYKQLTGEEKHPLPYSLDFRMHE